MRIECRRKGFVDEIDDEDQNGSQHRCYAKRQYDRFVRGVISATGRASEAMIAHARHFVESLGEGYRQEHEHREDEHLWRKYPPTENDSKAQADGEQAGECKHINNRFTLELER